MPFLPSGPCLHPQCPWSALTSRHLPDVAMEAAPTARLCPSPARPLPHAQNLGPEQFAPPGPSDLCAFFQARRGDPSNMFGLLSTSL